MDCYTKVEKLHSRGQYSRVMTFVGDCPYEDYNLEQLKKFCEFVFSSAVELKDYQKFKEFFYKMKGHFQKKYEPIHWIECLKYLRANTKLPKFFIQEELIQTYRSSGRMEEFEKECQEQLDHSIRRRINTNPIAYKDILGERVEIYDLLHKIYKGYYQDVTDRLKRFKNKLQAKKFQKIVRFIAANINLEECKRIEIKEVITAHLAKKRELEISYYNRDDIRSFEKAMIRNFINVIILDFKNKDPIIDLIDFLTQTGNKKLRGDLLQCLEKCQEIKEDKRFKKLKQDYIIKTEGRKDVCVEHGGESKDGANDCLERRNAVMYKGSDHLPSFKGLQGQDDESAGLSREILMEVNIQKDEWFIEKFEKVVIGLIGLNLYESAVSSIKRIKKINNGKIKSVDINYLEAEVHLLRRDYINAIRVCQETLNQESLSFGEEICFEYLKGEAYFCFGENLKAYKSFKKVFNVSPSYRLVCERLKILEKSK